MAEDATVAKAFVQIMPSMDGATSSITDTIMPGINSAASSGGMAFGNIFSGKLGTTLKAAGGVIVGALAVDALKDSFQAVEGGFNNVIVATGATGEAAEELKAVYKDVASHVVGDFGDIGEAIGELNTRLGLSGDALETASEQTMKYAKINGQDAKTAVVDVTRMMNSAGISAEDYGKTLDLLTVAAQQSGIDVGTLANSVTDNAASFRELGFSTEESIAMLASFEKSGANTSQVLAGMKKGVAEWAKEGMSAQEGFAEFVAGVQDGSVSAADAIDIFGSRAGVTMYDAALKGQLDYEQMCTAITEGSEGALDQVYQDTLTASEKFDLMGQSLQVGFFSVIEPIVDAITPHIDELVSAAQGAVDFATSACVPAIEALIDNFDVIGPIIAGVTAGFVAFKTALMISELVTALSVALGVAAAAEDVMAVSQAFLNVVMEANPIVLIVTLIAGLIAALVVAYNTNEDFRNIVNDAWESIWSVIEPIASAIGEALSALGEFFGSLGESAGQWAGDIAAFWTDVGSKAAEVFAGIQGTIGSVWDAVSSKTSEIWDAASSFLSGCWDGLKSGAEAAFSAIQDEITGNLQTAQQVGSEAGSALTSLLSGDWANAQEHAANAFEAIKGSVSDKLSSARDLAGSAADAIGGFLGFPGLGDTVRGIFDSVRAAIEDPLEAAKEFVSSAISAISDIITGANLKLPDIKLPHFNIDGGEVPWGIAGQGFPPSISIDWYARGGFIDKPTLLGADEDGFAVGGERGIEMVWPGYEPYFRRYAAAIAEHMPQQRYGPEQTFNIYSNDPERTAAMVAARQRRALCY